MHFEPRQAVDDFYSGGFHHLRCSQVILFIKAGFEFYEYGYFLSVLRCCYQCIDDRRVFGYTILRYHDFFRLRIVYSFIQEVYKVFKRVVRIIKQQVFLLHIVEYGFFFIQAIQLHRFGLFQ